MRLLARRFERVELIGYPNQGRTTMKLATLALAFAFALSSTYALATTNHHKHKSGTRTYYSGQSNYNRYSGSYGRYNGSYGGGRYYGNPNDRGGLVGGADPGTYKP